MGKGVVCPDAVRAHDPQDPEGACHALDTPRRPPGELRRRASRRGRRAAAASLSELLKAAGLLTDHRGARRTAYSFRHFRISQQLVAGVDVFLVAENTGTSSDMIERFYGQVKLERMAKELRPEWRTGARS